MNKKSVYCYDRDGWLCDPATEDLIRFNDKKAIETFQIINNTKPLLSIYAAGGHWMAKRRRSFDYKLEKDHGFFIEYHRCYDDYINTQGWYLADKEDNEPYWPTIEKANQFINYYKIKNAEAFLDEDEDGVFRITVCSNMWLNDVYFIA